MHGFQGGWVHGANAFCAPWGGLMMIITVLAIIALVYFIVTRAGKSKKSLASAAIEKGTEILIERFTRGEIDADTFRKMKAELDS